MKTIKELTQRFDEIEQELNELHNGTRRHPDHIYTTEVRLYAEMSEIKKQAQIIFDQSVIH